MFFINKISFETEIKRSYIIANLIQEIKHSKTVCSYLTPNYIIYTSGYTWNPLIYLRVSGLMVHLSI